MDNHDWATRAVGQSVRRLRVPGRTWPSANAKCNGAFAGYVLAAAAESSAYCGAGAREPVCLLLTFAMHHIARWVATGDVDVAVAIDLISEPKTWHSYLSSRVRVLAALQQARSFGPESARAAPLQLDLFCS